MIGNNDDYRGRVDCLSAQGVTSGYGRVQILHKVSLEVGKRDVVGVLGRNGAGKTTLLKTIMGIVRQTHGQIVLNGTKVLGGKSPSAIARFGIGYVPQGRAIFPALTVHENLRVAQYAMNAKSERVDEVIEMFSALKPHLGSRGGGLSGGQQQILALARALVGSPSLLLLDEPSEGIQPSILESIVDILRGLMDKSSLSILLVEQNLEFAASLASCAYVMDMGRVSLKINKSELESRQLARDLMVAT
jgi:urea ABC transporter ATP-binding protein UrtE